MAEQLDSGVTIPFVNIGTDINRGLNSRVVLDVPNKIVTLTKDTNTTNNRDFKSALELTDYDIKVNVSPDKDRDSQIYDYSSANENGIHYDRRLTLRDLGQHITNRIKESMDAEETYNINLRGSYHIGTPNSSNIVDAFDEWKNGDKEGKPTESNLNGAGASPDGFGMDSIPARRSGYIGDFSNASDFIARYCDTQSGIAMGDAKVLNPDFQFNEMDDVRTDFRRPKLGRLYAERIYDYNLPTVYFCPGKIEIRVNTMGIVSAFTRENSKDLSNYIKDAGSNNAVKLGIAKMGNILGHGVAMGAKHILDTTQWYKWTPLTTKYMKYVNEMLIQLAVWMGLIDPESDLLVGWQEELNQFNKDVNNSESDESKVQAATKTLTAKWKSIFGSKKNNNNVVMDKTTGAMVVSGYLGASINPEHKGLLSVLTILPQYTKNHWITTGHFNSDVDLTDDKNFTTEEMKEDPDSSLLPPDELFIPFGMCKGVSVSESFSNSVGEHPLVNEYNNLYEDAHTTDMTTGFNVTTGVDAASKAAGVLNNINTNDIMGSVASVGTDLVSQYGAKIIQQRAPNEIGMITSGAGRFVLPEVWTNSTFDRSYSITFKFRSPYGHRLSIFENTMVPLLFLISMTAPRAVGLSSYTNPFYIKAFSKGLFSCDLGMITSLSISRGEDKNDRTTEGFFRTVTASVSIKDMLPTMHMGLGVGQWDIVNATNNGMIAYMCNLAGVDFIERANLKIADKFVTQRLRTEYQEFGSSIRAWMAGKPAGASILGMSAKSFGKVADPMKDRKYHNEHN